MAFNSAYLYPIGGNPKRGQVPTLWMYLTADAAATVDTVGYFDNGSTTNTGMRNVMMIGDVIIRMTVDSVTAPTTVSASGMHYVNSNASGIIDTTDTLAFTATDTD
jgi:hypothetical protein